MIPNFITLKGALWSVLPPGEHLATIDEIQSRYAINSRRHELFAGLKRGLDNLFAAGCRQVFLDGSYVTAKPFPNDYELCWDSVFVHPDILDPVFLDFDQLRLAQKEKYLGEYFPTIMTEGFSGKPFVDFFQTDLESGQKKGIIKLLNYIRKGEQYDY